MGENEFQFRTAAFGGFQKQDVIDYLERNAREHAQKIAALQKELSEERTAKAAEEERSFSLEGRVAALEAESQQLTADLTQRTEQLDQAAAELAEARAASAQLQAEMARIRSLADAYEAVKDRTATIELEAHGRAQAIEKEGHIKAQKYQEQVKVWFSKTQEAYDRLRADMTTIMDRAMQELTQVSQTMETLSSSLTDQDSALAAIQAQIEALDSAKPPQPLPLEESRW